MLYKHITINELINLEGNFYNNISPLECAKRMKIGKDKVYKYYKKFKADIYGQVLEISAGITKVASANTDEEDKNANEIVNASRH